MEFFEDKTSFTDNLIEYIKEFEVLYNKKHKMYFDIHYKRKCWNEIAIKLNRSGKYTVLITLFIVN